MAFKGSKGSKSITVEKEGYLWVKTNLPIVKGKEKQWHQKYIVLRKSFGDGTFLEWYENFEAFIAHKNPTKLKLDGIDYIGEIGQGDVATYPFILFGGGQSQLQMAAKTEAERGEWIKALNHCLQNGKKSGPTSPIMPRPSIKTGYRVKLKDYTCSSNQHELRDNNRDYTMVIGPRSIRLLTDNMKGEQKLVVSWLLENIKSYESRPLEQNPSQKLLSIDTGRRSSTGQGTFNFFTPHGDQIKKQISEHTKRSYFKKINSQDNFNKENLYSSSPEASRGLSSSQSLRSVSTSQASPVGSPKRATISSREGAMAFQRYDPPTRDSYCPYIEQPNGYVDIFTDQRKVEENRRRNSSRSSVSAHHPVYPDDHPMYIDVSEVPTPETEAGYIPVLPAEDSKNGLLPASGYINTSPPNDSPYIDVLAEEPSSPPTKNSTGSDDYPAYIQILPDEEMDQSPVKCMSRESSEDAEIYIDVDENRKTFTYESRPQHSETHVESREQRLESREQSLESREQRFVSREQRLETHYESCETTIESSVRRESREVHVSHNSVSRHTRASAASVSSPMHPLSVTSQTSGDFSSFSSENDVFQERELNVVCDVFTEEPATGEDVPRNSESQNSEIPATNVDNFSEKSNHTPGEDDSPKCNEGLLKPALPSKPPLIASKSASLPVRSEGLSTNSGVKADVNERRNELSPTPDGNSRNVKARSWHSDNGSDRAYTSGNSSSTSESENARNSKELSEEENSGPESPRDSVELETRTRSHTTGEILYTRKFEGGLSSSMLQTLERQLTHPQQFTLNKHPPLSREPHLTQDQIILQLENPMLGVGQLPIAKKNSSTVEIKYICSECGWHKKSKKRSSLKPRFRSRPCPICGTIVQRQDTKATKSKEKSSGGIFNKIIKKGRRSSDEKLDKKDIMKPERPSPTAAEPLFIKRVRDPTAFGFGRHSPSLDPKRVGLGIAPSPLQAFSAVSLDGESISRGSISYDENTSPPGRKMLGSSVSDGAATNPPYPASAPPISSSSNCSSNFPLGRTKSSPPLSSGVDAGSGDTLSVDGQEVQKIPRKNSALTLPTLPEVEDPGETNQSNPLDTPPPIVPPRTRELPPPLPPRRGNSPSSREDGVKLRRAQTDPAFSLPVMHGSPPVKPKSRISRTMTDPGQKFGPFSDSIRNAISLGDLLDDGNEELQMMKLVSLSLGEGIDTDTPPPPLPPRRGSGQAQPPPTAIPSRASNESESLTNSFEARSSNEGRPILPEKAFPGTNSPKRPLSVRRSIEAKRDFQKRNPCTAHM